MDATRCKLGWPVGRSGREGGCAYRPAHAGGAACMEYNGRMGAAVTGARTVGLRVWGPFARSFSISLLVWWFCGSEGVTLRGYRVCVKWCMGYTFSPLRADSGVRDDAARLVKRSEHVNKGAAWLGGNGGGSPLRLG
ncbi:MAG: hypothetical protein EBW76_06545 [Actinobacteria bacterium]|nr:hypothetical protein [Actinomycetota bacterium]